MNQSLRMDLTLEPLSNEGFADQVAGQLAKVVKVRPAKSLRSKLVKAGTKQYVQIDLEEPLYCSLMFGFHQAIITNAQFNNENLKLIIDNFELSKALFLQSLSACVFFYQNLMLINKEFPIIPERFLNFIDSLCIAYLSIRTNESQQAILYELNRIDDLLTRALSNCHE